MEKRPTVRDILAKSEAYLSDKGVDSPRLSAQMLLAHVLGLERLGLFLDMDRPLSESELARCRDLVARRGRGEPAAYLVGEREFYGLAFAVTRDVLIPRPETEGIVERVEALFPHDSVVRFADLGTGSGCLAVTLAVRFPAWTGVAVDKSAAALAVARENARRHGVDARMEFVCGDFSVLCDREERFGLVVSNPPYVSEAEYRSASPEVAGFEPKSALTPESQAPGGATGCECFPVLAGVARERLAPDGVFLMEMGCTQAEAARSAFAGFPEVAVRRDLAGLDRYVEVRNGISAPTGAVRKAP
ncbi:peptide chain release factor N(5)-glutamine methyltransferase [Desulfovibrio sulfodismutans]|uniref:Release factor glutamine methyltransferase n=1 Tax=Desulfolutivibrio sulfodismutans TaxID=63561 RepID=A0A7K3NNA9_9BACT|nr:peptide chain release factor N(5)-glutamine methyltransferase [Desulfolutivibrio sulfodismutans]NDY57670.1 peptide chain release factor N(5)-glutamine methyltransferase [Desulfolutivibrio sulfodismutans]QLA12277.1 peptide chain release factor N(5)-glutamine methyltransferase [Desulfolutivibrio sulfodismutans DSM 3696]